MLEKIVKIINYVVLVFAALVSVLFFLKDAKVLQQGLDALVDVPADVKIAEVDKMASNWSALIINTSIFLFIAIVAAIVLFSIYIFIKDAKDNPKTAIKPLLSIAFLGIIVLVSYLLGSEVMPQFLGADKFSFSPSTIKWVDVSLYMMYILFGISILALIYTEISKIWR